jgi:hypothetical protein
MKAFVAGRKKVKKKVMPQIIYFKESGTKSEI